MITSKILLYVKICHDLTESIHSGELASGMPLPTVDELKEQYKVSHVTVLRAYKQMMQSGLVQKSGRRYLVCSPGWKSGSDRMLFSGYRSLSSIDDRDNYGNQIIVGLMRSCAIHDLSFYVPALTSQFNGVLSIPDEQLRELVREACMVSGSEPLLVLDSRFTDSQIETIVLPQISGNHIAVVGRRSNLPVFSVGENFAVVGKDAARILSVPDPLENYWLVPGYGDQDQSNEAISFCIELLQKQGVDDNRIQCLPCCNQSYELNMELTEKIDSYLKAHSGHLSIFSVSPFWGRTLCSHLIKAGWIPGRDFRLLVGKGYDLCFSEEPKLSALRYEAEATGVKAVDLLASRDLEPVGFYPIAHSIKLNSTT